MIKLKIVCENMVFWIDLIFLQIIKTEVWHTVLPITTPKYCWLYAKV